MIDLTIILPCFNEEAAIGPVLDDLTSSVPGATICVVDDGSTDSTVAIVKSKQVLLVRHERNMGYGAALKTGIRRASSEYVGFFDADGQHSASDFVRLATEMAHMDLVVGSRQEGSHKPLLRQPGKWVLKVVAEKLCGRRIPDLNSGMRIMRRDLISKYLSIMPNGFSFSTTSTIAFHRDGYLVSYVPITAKKRVGDSTVNIVSDGLRTLLLIVKVIALFSPLRIFLPVAVVQFLLAIASFVSNWTVQGGNLSDGTILFSLSSLITFLMGLMAEQLSNIRREIGNR